MEQPIIEQKLDEKLTYMLSRTTHFTPLRLRKFYYDMVGKEISNFHLAKCVYSKEYLYSTVIVGKIEESSLFFYVNDTVNFEEIPDKYSTFYSCCSLEKLIKYFIPYEIKLFILYELENEIENLFTGLHL